MWSPSFRFENVTLLLGMTTHRLLPVRATLPMNVSGFPYGTFIVYDFVLLVVYMFCGSFINGFCLGGWFLMESLLLGGQ